MTTATGASPSDSVPATFSNPFGLGESESGAVALDDMAETVRQGDGVALENGAGMHGEPEGEGQSRSRNRDELCDIEVEPGPHPLKQEVCADMQDDSPSRRNDLPGSIWANGPDEDPAGLADRGLDRPRGSSGPVRSGAPNAGNGEANDGLPAAGAGREARSPRAKRSTRAFASRPSAPARHGESAPLISMSDNVAAPPTASASKARPGKADSGGEPARSIGRVAGSDLRRTDTRANLHAGRSERHPSFEQEQELPRFAPLSSEETPPDRTSLGAGRPAVQTRLWEAFTPSRPKYSSRFFAGRRWALQRIITAVEQDQAHVAIFGPRGIGKTSLANVLAESASEVEYQVLRYPCGSNATFEEIFRGLLRSLPADYLDRATQARFAGVENLEQLLPAGEFGPTDVTAILSQIKFDHAILIIDEFDRVESKHLKTQLAEAIKNISDVSARVTFIIIGIAHSMDELIGMHPSIQRHLVAIHLPLMTASELDHVVLAGEEASGVRFEDATRDMIVSFSKGLPYYAQLLCLHAGRKALERGSMLVQMADLRDALEMVLRESDPLAKASYEAATRDETDQFLIDVLFAAATAPFDDYGTFTAESAAEMCVDSEGTTLPETAIRQSLDDLAQQEHLRLIEKCAMLKDATRYSFVLQTMRQYILLRQAVRRGLM